MRLETTRLETARLETAGLETTRQQSWLLALLGVAVQWVKLGVLAIAGEWQRAADRALEDLQEASRDVGVMEWFWLGVLVLMAMGAWYMMLYAAGQQTGLW